MIRPLGHRGRTTVPRSALIVLKNQKLVDAGLLKTFLKWHRVQGAWTTCKIARGVKGGNSGFPGKHRSREKFRDKVRKNIDSLRTKLPAELKAAIAAFLINIARATKAPRQSSEEHAFTQNKIVCGVKGGSSGIPNKHRSSEKAPRQHSEEHSFTQSKISRGVKLGYI